MSGRNEIEMEKQFLADLEKAKALSLETLELEKIRKQRYSQPDPSAYAESRTLEEYKNYLHRKAQLYQETAQPTSHVPRKAFSTTAVPPPSSGSSRRNSEIRNFILEGQEQRAKDEADLISFNAAPLPPQPNPQDEAHNNLKELVDQMHR